MAKHPSRLEVREWNKKLERDMAREFPDLQQDDLESFEAAFRARIEKDPEGRTMMYASMLDHVLSEMEEEQRRKSKPVGSKPGSRTAKKKAKKKK